MHRCGGKCIGVRYVGLWCPGVKQCIRREIYRSRGKIMLWPKIYRVVVKNEFNKKNWSGGKIIHLAKDIGLRVKIMLRQKIYRSGGKIMHW